MKIKKIRLNRDMLKKKKARLNLETDIKLMSKEYDRLNRELAIYVDKDVFLALILRKNKSAIFCYVPLKCKSFQIDGNTYFNMQSGSYISNNTVLSVYLEGCVLPVEHSQVKYEQHMILLTDDNGRPVKELPNNVSRQVYDELPKDSKGNVLHNRQGFIIRKLLSRIKGLEFDSVIANAIFDSGLIEKVAHGDSLDKLIPIMLILNIVSIVLIGVCIAVSYFYGG